MLTWRCTRTLAAAAASTRPQDGKTPLEICEDKSYDDAAKRAAKEATRAFLRSLPPHSNNGAAAAAAKKEAEAAAARKAAEAAAAAERVKRQQAEADAVAAAQRVAAAEQQAAAAAAKAAEEAAARKAAEERAAAAERDKAAVLDAAARKAAPATSAAVPADVAALLSQLSLSQHAPALVTQLGLTCAADASMLTDADLEHIGMKPLERRKLLAAVVPSPVAPAPARVGCEVMISYRVSETGEGGDNSVFALKKALEARGHSVFVGEAAIQGGEEWPETIAAGVRDCAAFVVLCSPTYGDTVWTKRELVMADNLRKPLIPVWHSGAYPPKAAEIYLGGKQRIPGGNFGEGYVKARIAHERVAEEVAAALARAGVAPSRK